MFNNFVNWDELIKSNNPFWINILSKQIDCVAWILKNPTNSLVAQIFETDKNNGDYADNYSYISLCAKLWYEITKYDSGCGSTNEHCFQFIGRMVDKIIGQYREYEVKIKLEKISKLEREIEELKSSIITNEK